MVYGSYTSQWEEQSNFCKNTFIFLGSGRHWNDLAGLALRLANDDVGIDFDRFAK